MRFVAEGIRMVFFDRRYWRFILVPWMWSTLIFVGVVVVGYFALVPFIQGALDGRLGEGTVIANAAKNFVSLLYLVAWIFLAGFAFLTITSLTSSFLWDDLSRQVESQITGQPAPKSSLTNQRVIVDSISRGTFSILMAILSMACGWVVPVIAPVILAGWVGVLDYTSSSFLRYNRTVGSQWPVATKMKGWFGFQLVSGALSLLPFVNVLLLPALVAGGTSMAVRSGVLGGATVSEGKRE